jgi:hypothetical protein
MVQFVFSLIFDRSCPILRRSDLNFSNQRPLSGICHAFSPLVKKSFLSPNLGCQFKDSRTGKICGSKHFLQVDHVEPRFAGMEKAFEGKKNGFQRTSGFDFAAKCIDRV